MEWTKVSVRHAEIMFADASDFVFRAYVRLMLLTSQMELAPTSELCRKHLGGRSYNLLLKYLGKKGISVNTIIDKVLEDVDRVKHQRNLNKKRVHKHRCNALSNATDKIREDKIREDIGKKGRFTPPTPQEIQKFIKEKNYQISHITFFNYYQSNGWRVGKNKMKDWRAAIVNWNTRDKDKNKTTSITQREETADEKKMRIEYKKRMKEKEQNGVPTAAT